jgi:hypothetical protein
MLTKLPTTLENAQALVKSVAKQYKQANRYWDRLFMLIDKADISDMVLEQLKPERLNTQQAKIAQDIAKGLVMMGKTTRTVDYISIKRWLTDARSKLVTPEDVVSAIWRVEDIPSKQLIEAEALLKRAMALVSNPLLK